VGNLFKLLKRFFLFWLFIFSSYSSSDESDGGNISVGIPFTLLTSSSDENSFGQTPSDFKYLILSLFNICIISALTLLPSSIGSTIR
jgi:hypothetical protein